MQWQVLLIFISVRVKWRSWQCLALSFSGSKTEYRFCKKRCSFFEPGLYHRKLSSDCGVKSRLWRTLSTIKLYQGFADSEVVFFVLFLFFHLFSLPFFLFEYFYFFSLISSAVLAILHCTLGYCLSVTGLSLSVVCRYKICSISRWNSINWGMAGVIPEKRAMYKTVFVIWVLSGTDFW